MSSRCHRYIFFSFASFFFLSTFFYVRLVNWFFSNSCFNFYWVFFCCVVFTLLVISFHAELLALNSFHLWKFSTCFLKNDWLWDNDVNSSASLRFSSSPFLYAKRKRDGIKNVNFDLTINPFSFLYFSNLNAMARIAQIQSVFKHSNKRRKLWKNSQFHGKCTGIVCSAEWISLLIKILEWHRLWSAKRR